MKTILFLCAALMAMASVGHAEKPNILFIYLDDMGWRDVGFMGSDFYETPNLDALASKGLVFSDAYSCAANCAPARASLMSGQYTPRHKIFNVGTRPRGKSKHRRLEHIPGVDTLDKGIKTWAQQLQSCGYKTATMGKWHLSDDPVPYGFDVNVGGTHAGGPPRGYYRPHGKAPGLADAPDGEYLTDRLSTEAIKFIRDNKDQAWCLYLTHFAVHTPLDAKKELLAKYESKPSGKLHSHVKMATMIESVDQGVGRIMEALEQLDLSQKTAVFFYSDNGGYGPATDMAPLKGYKGNYYEGGIRVPFFAHWPGKFVAGKTAEPVTGVDFFPTLCELAGAKLPSRQMLDGVSLLPLLTGKSERLEARSLFWHFPAYLQSYGKVNQEQRDPLFRTRPCSVIRKGSWKLLQYFEDQSLELFSLDNDPGETNNLVESSPAVAAELLKELKNWQVSVDAPIPTKRNPEFDAEAEKKAIKAAQNSAKNSASKRGQRNRRGPASAEKRGVGSVAPPMAAKQRRQPGGAPENKNKNPRELRPNIVFIFSDDHAPNAIGAYDGWLKSVNPTPHIDQLARDGMLFRNSFCTNSICGPSRAVILTGKHSHLNGFRVNGDRFDGTQQTFPKLMRKAGYKTAMIGKWHLGSDPTGFDYWDVLPGQGRYYNPRLKSPSGMRTVEGHCTEIVTDLAIDWLEENKNNPEPFMLMCQHKAPHRCWMPAPEHLQLYADLEIPEPPTLFDKFADNASPARFQEMEIDRHMHPVFDLFFDAPPGWTDNKKVSADRSGFNNLKVMSENQLATWNKAFERGNESFRNAKLEGKELVRAKYQRYIKNYLRCIRGVDDSVGRINDYLKRNGLAENTLVIYSSDQGFYLGDHGWYDKRWMYEESMSMPLIVKWPGVTKPGSVSKKLVQNLDYAETFLDLAGADIPADMQGKSLVPILSGKNPVGWRDAVYYHYFEYPGVHMVARHDGVRTDRYKLIRFYQFDEWEFYDLESDPDELVNEYRNPKYAAEIARLKKRLAELRDQYHDNSDRSVAPDDWQKKYRSPSASSG